MRCRTSARICSSAPKPRGPLTDPEYIAASTLCRRLAREQGIDAVMTMHRLDAIVAPTLGPAWPTDLVNGDHILGAQLDTGGSGRLSKHDGAGWLGRRAAGRDPVHGPGLERIASHQPGVRVRTGQQASQAAAFPADDPDQLTPGNGLTCPSLMPRTLKRALYAPRRRARASARADGSLPPRARRDVRHGPTAQSPGRAPRAEPPLTALSSRRTHSDRTPSTHARCRSRAGSGPPVPAHLPPLDDGRGTR